MKNKITLNLTTANNTEGVNIDFIVKDLGNKKGFLLSNVKIGISAVYSYNTLVFVQDVENCVFYRNAYTNYSATTRKHIYKAVAPFVSYKYDVDGLKTKTGNSKETFIKFIDRTGLNVSECGVKFPQFLELRNFERIYTPYSSDGYIKRNTKGII